MDIVLMLLVHYGARVQNDVTCCWPIKMQAAIKRRILFCDVANSLLQLTTPCRVQRICSDKRNIFGIFRAVNINTVLLRYRTPCNYRKSVLPPSSQLMFCRWRQHVLPKHYYLSTKLHDTIPEISYLQKGNWSVLDIRYESICLDDWSKLRKLVPGGQGIPVGNGTWDLPNTEQKGQPPYLLVQNTRLCNNRTVPKAR
jgi:hypothetical protein